MRALHFENTRGITAVEVLVSVSIAALILVSVTHAIVAFVNTGRTISEKTAALYLAEEGLELVRFVRDESWSTISGLSTSGTHYLSVSSTDVDVVGVPETLGEYSRSFTVQNVYRNATTDDIVASTTGGSVADNDAKYVTVTVSWGTPTQSVALTSIIANLDP